MNYKQLDEDKPLREVVGMDGGSIAEKERRIYYQDIVYSVCNLLDTVYTPSTCCGMSTSPTTEVQDRVKSLIEYRNQQGEKYQTELAALREQLVELREIAERMADWMIGRFPIVPFDAEYFKRQLLHDYAIHQRKYAKLGPSGDGGEMTDAEKLLKLAQWFDVRDAQSGITDNREVQSDLRRIAARITALETLAELLGDR